MRRSVLLGAFLFFAHKLVDSNEMTLKLRKLINGKKKLSKAFSYKLHFFSEKILKTYLTFSKASKIEQVASFNPCSFLWLT